MIRTALLSVSDKSGIVPFAKSLHECGVKLISTGGTAKLLAENGLPVVEVAGLEVGMEIRAEGMVGEEDGSLVILNPSYELVL